MKLRNKKTGEIDDFLFEVITDRIDFYRRVGTTETKNIWRYNSLAELNEEWEDYAPKEPLIKDEKIRKAVRAWAEANDYGKDEEYQYEDFSTGWKSWSLEHHQNGDDNEIHFNGGIDFRKMNHQGYYTIAELCGEEEE